MLGFKIEQPKEFMTQLFKNKLFDDYGCSAIEVATITDFKISGLINKSFFDDTTPISEAMPYLEWHLLKPIVYTMIKGNKSPLQFKMTLILPPTFHTKLLQHYQLTLPLETIKGMYINIHFKDSVLKLTSAISLNTFVMDKTIDHAWDDYVQKLLKKHQLLFELV